MDEPSNESEPNVDAPGTDSASGDGRPNDASPVDDRSNDGPRETDLDGADESPLDRGPGARGQDHARKLRNRLAPGERERVEGTVADLLDLFGRAHAIAVLSTFAFADEPLRFSELERRLEIPANTLSVRLDELVAAGLLRRESYAEVPPRVEYEPTEKARALFPAFGHLHVWADKYDLDPVGE
ncbi:winged helix-turn-helix transcriptional regulator [Halosolutus halophilus]|uniref:winged helix-turn-helix transcriptional regulator n=1 Tax=Halosolutus halophilus TaxID=1552990 RepID=UPI0022350AC7|nr:helix-turn-helix domain-containing protein [Halosolutus halophilus]